MPIDMNQTIAEASLTNLNDIIVPDAVGFFPLAPGWIIVTLLVLALLFHFALNAYHRYKKSLYKREAIKEIENYSNESREEILELLTLAKRVGIAAYGRDQIAKLSGESWWDFMEKHSKVKIDKGLRDELSGLLYDASTQHERIPYVTVKEMVTLWIKTHKDGDHA